MRTRFVSIVLAARWSSVLVAVMYHVRFLVFANYGDLLTTTGATRAFYFVTGLGHESFAVFFVLDGILTGLALRPRPPDLLPDRTAPARHTSGLYRLMLPGLALGAALDVAGARLFNGTGVYTDYPAFSTLTLSATALLGNLAVLQPFVMPTFGSNSMLYLFSYLFWSHVLLALFLRAPPFVRPGLAAAVLVFAPLAFLTWAGTWLAGFAVVHMASTRALRPSLPATCAGLAGALLLSRVIGADQGLLPPPFGRWLIDCKYLLVGASCALAAWAACPARMPCGVAAGQAAPFAFFFHFPVMMLCIAAGSTLLGEPLKQQPAPARYAAFAIVVAVCVGVATLVVRSSEKARRQAAFPWPGAGHPP